MNSGALGQNPVGANNGRTLRAHDRVAARPGENRHDESGVQHDESGAVAQARCESEKRLAGHTDGRIGASAVEKMRREVAAIARIRDLKSANLSEIKNRLKDFDENLKKNSWRKQKLFLDVPLSQSTESGFK